MRLSAMQVPHGGDLYAAIVLIGAAVAIWGSLAWIIVFR
jgi:hypothetical protein